MSDPPGAEPVPAAMRSPATRRPPRRADSIRRTSHIDLHRDDHGLVLEGRARDLITTTAGADVADAAGMRARIDQGGALAELALDPAGPGGAGLLGLPVAAGFRRAARDAFPEAVTADSPLALLLDDLPVAALISGYARLYSGDVPADGGGGIPVDVCSGWRADGTMMTSVRAGLGVPVPLGPAAPTLDAERRDDELAWHALGPLPAGSMRRRRLLDVHRGGDSWIVTAMFRDTHVQAGGAETVLHEYTLDATVDATTRVVLICSAIPRVLPWVECPVAAASSDRLVGVEVDAIRDHVGARMRGISTCTHLNDLLRSLGATGRLMDILTTTRPPTPEAASDD